MPDESADAADPLQAWLGVLRADEAASHRRRTGSLARRLTEEATLSGVLLELAEGARPVLLHTATGRRHRGRLTLVTGDCCAVRTDTGGEVLVALASLAAVRPAPGSPGVAGTRRDVPRGSLGLALSSLAADTPVVAVVASDGETVRGNLVAAGADVVAVRPAGADAPVYLPLACVSEVSLLESG